MNRNQHEIQPRKQGKEVWRQMGAQKSLVTVFADNLPRNSTVSWIWKVFGRARVVVDVFIPNKARERNQLKFAFVRYVSRTKALNVIQHLDGWIMWGCKLRLTEAKYIRGIGDKINEGRVAMDPNIRTIEEMKI
ncbi:serine/arginine-rich splicing factor SC35-like [Arachis hypogaea]|uniref:serine/arginine-rich splicing factor SC35-like n=1 Tax=Arachis hypogaea TaxID=3818 RepID=UPI003B217C0C